MPCLPYSFHLPPLVLETREDTHTERVRRRRRATPALPFFLFSTRGNAKKKEGEEARVGTLALPPFAIDELFASEPLEAATAELLGAAEEQPADNAVAELLEAAEAEPLDNAVAELQEATIAGCCRRIKQTSQ